MNYAGYKTEAIILLDTNFESVHMDTQICFFVFCFLNITEVVIYGYIFHSDQAYFKQIISLPSRCDDARRECAEYSFSFTDVRTASEERLDRIGFML